MTVDQMKAVLEQNGTLSFIDGEVFVHVLLSNELTTRAIVGSYGQTERLAIKELYRFFKDKLWDICEFIEIVAELECK